MNIDIINININIIIITLGFALDLLFGDPEGWPHPVILMGRIISRLEKILRGKFNKNPGYEFISGVILVLIVIFLCFFTPLLILYAADKINKNFSFLLRVYWTWRILAIKNMADEGKRVYNKLNQNDLLSARKAVSRIVGRDTENLDCAGVIKAAIESISENFTDGIIAPMFYLFLGGVPLAMAFKAISTMDSMIGYRTEKYHYFGRAAAKLDDAANYIPARIAALCWICAAGVTGQDMKNAYKIWRRDANKTDSPNAGQTESACAGALGIRLGGPAVYFGEYHEKAYLGDDLKSIQAADILRANRILYAASLIFLGVLNLTGILYYILYI